MDDQWVITDAFPLSKYSLWIPSLLPSQWLQSTCLKPRTCGFTILLVFLVPSSQHMVLHSPVMSARQLLTQCYTTINTQRITHWQGKPAVCIPCISLFMVLKAPLKRRKRKSMLYLRTRSMTCLMLYICNSIRLCFATTYYKIERLLSLIEWMVGLL